ncbi:hypothetical protein ACFWRV_31975 [Streptomyces sp. NPDC058576]|uniref:hypothetical protein n=1 Tax=Streptomyces sp. NPDC058576 TaxID=3346547 RepID=UPI003669D6D3
MTRTPNDRTNPPGGTGLPKGAGPIDTGTPVRRPGTHDPATRTVTGKETEPVGQPATAPGTPVGQPAETSGAAVGQPAEEAPGTLPGPTAPDAAAEPRTSPGRKTPEAGPAAARGPAEDGPPLGKPLFAPAEQEAFTVRIQQAVTGFVEDPHRAVRDADATFEEVVADLGAALAERGRLLRAGKDEGGPVSGAETEDLRIALQHYRDLTERLVRL